MELLLKTSLEILRLTDWLARPFFLTGVDVQAAGRTGHHVHDGAAHEAQEDRDHRQAQAGNKQGNTIQAPYSSHFCAVKCSVIQTFFASFIAVLRIRILLATLTRIWIRILLVTVMRIWILLFPWRGSGSYLSLWCGSGSLIPTKGLKPWINAQIRS
jgi:hypothetical protein